MIRCFLSVGPAPRDRLAGEVHDRVDAVERAGVDVALRRDPSGTRRRGARPARASGAATASPPPLAARAPGAEPIRPLAPVTHHLHGRPVTDIWHLSMYGPRHHGDHVAGPRRRDHRGRPTAALAYVTPAGGAVVTAVAPIGLRDRERRDGHLHDLARLRQEARAHRAQPARGARLPRPRARLRRSSPTSCSCRATRRPSTEPDRASTSRTSCGRRPSASWARRSAGKLFWDRWLREYYRDRVPVDGARRADERLAGPARRGRPRVLGAPLPASRRRRRRRRRRAPARASTP